MGKDYDAEYEDNSEQSLYTDGEDRRPKIVLIVVGVVVLLIIVLIFFFACSDKDTKSNNNYLSNISVSSGQLNPAFAKDTLTYSVAVIEDFVTVSCSSESSKAITDGCNKRIYLTEECNDHVIKVTSESKEIREYKLNICKQSSEAPIIKNIKLSPDGFTKEKVTVVVEAESNNGLNEKAYSFDGGTTWQTSNSFIVTENKVLEIKVRDKNNNESAIFTKKIETIDNTKPTVTIIGSVDSGVSTTSHVVLTAVVSPNTTASGYKYQWYKGESAIKGATESTYTATSSGNYKVKVTTGSNNSVTSAVFVVNKKTGSNSDKLSIDSVSKNTTSWTNKEVTLTVKVTSSNGLASKGYSFDGGKTFGSSKTKSFSSNQTVKIVVKDKKGKTASYTEYITNIDKTSPTVSITGGNTVGSTLTAKVTPTTVPSKYIGYQWYFNTEPIKSATSSSYVATKAGRYEVKVTTGAGNSAKSNVFEVRQNVPGNVQLTASTPSNIWTNKNVTLTAKVTNGTAKSYKWYSNNTLISTTSTGSYVVTANNLNSTYKVIVEFTNGTTKTSSPYIVKIDKTAPTITIDARLSSYTGSKYNEGSWTNKDIYINVSASDNQEMEDLQFQYLKGDNTWYSAAPNAWVSKKIDGTKGTAKIRFTGERDYPFTVKAIDAAGNVTTKKIETKIDKTAPTCKWTGPSYAPALLDDVISKVNVGDYVYNSLKCSDVLSGVNPNKTLEIGLDASNNIQVNTKMLKAEGNLNNFTGLYEMEIISASTGAWVNYYLINVSDAAGNVNTQKISSKKITVK